MYLERLFKRFDNLGMWPWLQILILIFGLNSSACYCKKSIQGQSAVSWDMEIPQTLLVGSQRQVKVIFRTNGAENRDAIKDYRLKVAIKEQRSFIGSGQGTQIQYQDAADNQQIFSEPFEKSLTEWKKTDELMHDHSSQDFYIAFDLLPVDEIIKVRLNVELVDSLEKTVSSIEVEWIKDELVIHPPAEFKDGETFFTLQSLKEDIKNPEKITLYIQSVHQHALFVVDGVKKTKATLSELLPGMKVLYKDQVSNPIKIALDKINGNQTGLFNVMVFADKDAPPLSNDNKEQETSSELNTTSIEGELKEIKKLQAQEQLDEQELDYLQQLEKVLQAEAKEIIGQLEEEEKTLEESKKKILLELKENKEKALKGKTKFDQAAVNLAYQKQKTKVLLASGSRSLKNRYNYSKGLGNALSHNFFGVALKEPTNFHYSKGQVAGHGMSLALAGTEAAIGSGLIGVGVFVTAAGVVPSLGTIETVTIPTIAAGAVLVGHSVFVNMRAQANLTKSKTASGDLQSGLPEKYIQLIKKIQDHRKNRQSKPSSAEV